MEYGSIPGVERKISRIVQGTALGGPPEALHAALDDAYEAGVRAFDTARVYNNEKIIGEWLAKTGTRNDWAIIAKGAHHGPQGGRVTPKDIIDDLNTSLDMLGTDFADLCILHRDDLSVEVGPIVECLHGLKEEGRIGAFGGSNWTHERIAEANAYAAAHGLTPFACSSPNLSLAEMAEPPWPGCIGIGGGSGKAARDWYQAHDVALFPWSSLAGGFLTGRFTRDNIPQEGYHDTYCKKAFCSEENFQRLDRVKILAEERGLSIAQIALAWTFSLPLNVFPLVGSRNKTELDQNIAALNAKLSADEVAWLNLEQDNR